MKMTNNTEETKVFTPASYEELKEALGSYDDEYICPEFMRGEYSNDYRPDGIILKELNSVNSYGGEGQGDDYYNVYKFILMNDEVVYIKFEGWYASYDGATYNCAIEVEPKEVTSTVYFAK